MFIAIDIVSDSCALLFEGSLDLCLEVLLCSHSWIAKIDWRLVLVFIGLRKIAEDPLLPVEGPLTVGASYVVMRADRGVLMSSLSYETLSSASPNQKNHHHHHHHFGLSRCSFKIVGNTTEDHRRVLPENRFSLQVLHGRWTCRPPTICCMTGLPRWAFSKCRRLLIPIICSMHYLPTFTP